MSKVGDLILKAGELSVEELTQLSKAVNLIARERFRQTAVVHLAQFAPGDTVVVTHGSRRLPLGSEGRVERLGSKNVSVDFGIFRTWRIPAQWLKHAEPAVTKK